MKTKHYYPYIPLHIWERLTEAEKQVVLKRAPCVVEEQTPNFFVTQNHREEMEYGLTAKHNEALDY